MLGRNSQRVEGLIGGLENLTGTGAPKPGPAIYDLAPADAFPQIDKPIKAQLIVPDPNAIILFDSQKILVRNGEGTYSNINDAQWADNLPKLIQARIVQSFENARQLSAVSRPLEQLNAAYRLELAIRSFQILIEPSAHAVVDVTARLVSDKGVISGARVFTASVPAKSADAPDAAAALNEAFSQSRRRDRGLDGRRDRGLSLLCCAPPAPSIWRSAPHGRHWSRGNKCAWPAGASSSRSGRR